MSDEPATQERPQPEPKRRRWGLGCLALALLALVLFLSLPGWVDRGANRVTPPPQPPARGPGEALHAQAPVLDLHADSLLWNRDLLSRAQHGHVDVPRLIEGGVWLQAFTIVTKTPLIPAQADIGAPPDVTIRALALAQGWPPETWTSLTARALYQARELQRAADASGGRLRVIRSRPELEAYLRERAEDPNQTAGFLGIEGAHCLEGRIEAVDELYEAGVRMIGLTHFFDNELGGSAHGVSDAGLSDFGREVVTRMEALGIAVDLAHASPKLIEDVCGMVSKPVLVSHTGVQGTTPGPRNLSDESLQHIAATGGVVGIGFFPMAVGGSDFDAIVAAIQHVAKTVGVDHVAYGSDWDGTVSTPIDAAGLPLLTSALMDAGFSDAEVRKIIGGNTLRVLRATLPP